MSKTSGGAERSYRGVSQEQRINQDESRCGVPPSPHSGQNRPAIHKGQAEIENDDIKLLVTQASVSGATIFRPLDDEFVSLVHRLDEPLGQLSIIFHEKDFHMSPEATFRCLT